MTPTPFLAALLLPWIWRDAAKALTLVVFCCAFGATAGVQLDSGSPVLITVCAMLPVLWHALRTARHECAYLPAGIRTLFALVVWAILLTVFVPRLLEGAIQVIGAVVRGPDVVSQLVPLQPQRGNLNQMAYLLFALLTASAAGQLLDAPSKLRQFADALLLVSGVNLLLAFLQALHLYAGLPYLLEGLANAGYVVHFGGSLGGLKRLSGGFSEPAGFAGFTLTVFAVCRSLARHGHRPRLASALSYGSLAALLLSTSTTAYVGLTVLYGAYGCAWLCRALVAPDRARLEGSLAAPLLAGAIVLVALLFSPAFQDGIAAVAQSTLFDKGGSDSGRERGVWNAQAWSIFTDTYGLGIGVGSTRSSSYPLVLLSNVGLVGTGLFILFFAQTAGRALQAPHSPPASVAAAHGMLATLAAASVSATVFDLGVMFYLLAGAASRAAVMAGPVAPMDLSSSAVAGRRRPGPAALVGVNDGR